MFPSAHPHSAAPAPVAPRLLADAEPAEESWFGLFARFGIGLSPELLDLGELRHRQHGFRSETHA